MPENETISFDTYYDKEEIFVDFDPENSFSHEWEDDWEDEEYNV